MEDSFYQESDSLDSVTVNCKYNYGKNFELILLCLVFSVIVITITGAYIFAMMGMWKDFFYTIAHPIQRWNDVCMLVFLCVLLFATSLVICINGIGSYTLVFDNNGITGTYSNWAISNGDFIDAITVKNRYTRYTIFDVDYVEGNRYISLDSFKSFSRYKDCIILWRTKHPQDTFGMRFFLRYNSWGLLPKGNCPLRVCSNGSDLANLQDFLSQRLPQVQPL